MASWGRYSGHESVVGWFKGDMSPLGIAVADLLGEVFQGLYHINVNKVDWSHPRMITVNIDKYGSRLATWDFDGLTRLVMLCHDRALRCEIEPCNNRFIRLVFHARSNRHGCMMDIHPTLEYALNAYREKYPKDTAEIQLQKGGE